MELHPCNYGIFKDRLRTRLWPTPLHLLKSGLWATFFPRLWQEGAAPLPDWLLFPGGRRTAPNFPATCLWTASALTHAPGPLPFRSVLLRSVPLRCTPLRSRPAFPVARERALNGHFWNCIILQTVAGRAMAHPASYFCRSGAAPALYPCRILVVFGDRRTAPLWPASGLR